MSLQGNLGRIFFHLPLGFRSQTHTHMHTNTNKRVLTLRAFGWLSCCDSGRRTMNTALQKSHRLRHIIRVMLLVTAEHKLGSHQLRRTKQLLENYRHMFSKHEGIKKWKDGERALKTPLNHSLNAVFYFVLRCFLLKQEVWVGPVKGLVLFKNAAFMCTWEAHILLIQGHILLIHEQYSIILTLLISYP